MSQVRKLLLFLAMSIFIAASPVSARDYSSQKPGGRGATQDSKDEQSAKEAEKEAEKLLNSCAQQVASIERRLNKLQADMSGKHVGASVREELKKLEQKLKEANEIVRPLQIF
jgi:hypothetical protein